MGHTLSKHSLVVLAEALQAEKVADSTWLTSTVVILLRCSGYFLSLFSDGRPPHFLPTHMPLSQTSLSLIFLLPGPDQPVKSTASAMKSTYPNLDTCLSTPSE